MELFNNLETGAIISECNKYRYKLWRIWDSEKPLVMFLMLNPSTADANSNDPTIRRCINFAKFWGYGGIVVCNLFAYRATNPKDLLKISNPIGDLNVVYIKECIELCERVICAWGNASIVKKMAYMSVFFNSITFGRDKLCFIDRSKNGTPKHPLYLKSDLTPQKFILKIES